MQALTLSTWFIYLSPWQQKLVKTALTLLEREEKTKSHLFDYSFIVFPMAKAYEGFLKKVLLDLGLINQATYEGNRFRIGRALNPDLPDHYKDEYWLYDNLAKKCGPDATRFAWDTWLSCRNRIFHFFPKEKAQLDLVEAKDRLQMMAKAMEQIVICIFKN